MSDDLRISLQGDLEDPLTFERMNSPVRTACGHIFDRTSIEDWLSRSDTCPICRGEIGKLVPDNITREKLGLSPKEPEFEPEPEPEPEKPIAQQPIHNIGSIQGNMNYNNAREREDTDCIYLSDADYGCFCMDCEDFPFSIVCDCSKGYKEKGTICKNAGCLHWLFIWGTFGNENTICQTIWGCAIVLWLILIVILFFVDIIVAFIGLFIFLIWCLLFPILFFLQMTICKCCLSDDALFAPLMFCCDHNVLICCIGKTCDRH